MSKQIIIGTRGSRLALWQAEFTQSALTDCGIESVLKVIQTKGDRQKHLSFDKIEGKGFFTKEIEDALLRGEVDMAVHSMKDLPTTPPPGLVTTAVSYRETPSDMLLIRSGQWDASRPLRLPEGAQVGTSSARRKAQLLDLRPDLRMVDIRGNVPTRINKLRAGDFDAIMLAAAGIQRLELDVSDLKTVTLDPREFVPAPAQGVLAFQTRADNMSIRRILKKIHQPEVSAVTNVERKVLKLLGGGCHMPVGVYCQRDQMGHYHVWAAQAEQWDSPLRRARLSSSTTFELAEQIVAQLKPKEV